jgi:polar amino acid transport system substrate-binding protein
MRAKPILAAALFLLVAAPAVAQDLAPTGTLRATFIATNPVQASTDPKTGVVSGPAAEITRELAKKHNLPFTIRGVEGVRGVIDSVKSGVADIGFVAFEPTRAGEVDFAQTYLLAHNTYVVRAESAIHAVIDIDRPGIRVGAGEIDVAGVYLKRNLKHAVLVPNPSSGMPEALHLLLEGKVEAYAANKERLVATFGEDRRFRILPDNFLSVRQAIAVPKGNAARLAAVNAFLDEARASGLVQGAIERARLRGVDVAPKP